MPTIQPLPQDHQHTNGLDRQVLRDIEQRFLSINQTRLERAHATLADRQNIVLDLLPLLFHCNHPLLPGYIDREVPSGISQFTPSDHQLRQARRIARGFKYIVADYNHRYIHSVFMMGSAGTIAYGGQSDFDIWLCHKPGLAEQKKQQMKEKCVLIEKWAHSLGVEMHCFLMNNDSFRSGHASELSEESSGSAQHHLLLDEFYRTSIYLAGRLPLWWFTPPTKEAQHHQHTQYLQDRIFIRRKDVIDFGGLPTVPSGEFIGASVWQLYKGIDSPYKSVLKLMLLEVYARQYPNFIPLSLTYKTEVYKGQTDPDYLDSYILTYQTLERYCLDRGETQRLELIRRCLYFKINKPLSTPPARQEKSWQRKLLENLVAQWQWDTAYLQDLDARQQWPIEKVISERSVLINELTSIYHYLLNFAREANTTAMINHRDLRQLTRKVHAALERKAGKVEWINPSISQQVSEAKLQIKHAQTPQGDSRWTLQKFSQHQNLTSLKQARKGFELLLWSYCNRVWAEHTQVIVSTDQHTTEARSLHPLYQCLQQWLPLPLSTAHTNFQQATYVTDTLVLINCPLGNTSPQSALLQQAEVITRNSWNEVISHSSGEHSATHDAIQQLLNAFLDSLIGLPAHALPRLCVQAFQAYQADITKQWLAIFNNCGRFFERHGKQGRYILFVQHRYYVAQFQGDIPNVAAYNNDCDVLSLLEQPCSQKRPLLIDANLPQQSLLTPLLSNQSLGCIDVFYQIRGTQAHIHVFDTEGRLHQSDIRCYDAASLLRPLHRFIRSCLSRLTLNQDTLTDHFGVQPVNFYRLDKTPNGYQVAQQPVSTNLKQLSFINIQVIADTSGHHQDDSRSHPQYTFFCNQLEFSDLQHGDGIFDAVARYILQQRQGAERYPCYISDLDLGSPANAQVPWALADYLTHKTTLEQRLNHALQHCST